MDDSSFETLYYLCLKARSNKNEEELRVKYDS